MGLIPRYKIFADQNDITANIQGRLVSLSISDSAGIESDTLNIVIADDDNRVEMPFTGVRLEVEMGYDENLIDMGSFVVDDMSFKSNPQQYNIRASAAPVEGIQAAAMQSQKTRSFENITVNDVIKTVAGDHGLKSYVSDSIKDTVFNNIEQLGESDLNLVTRLSQDLNAIAKPAGGTLLFVKQGEGKSSTGESLAVVTVHESDVGDYTYRESVSKKAGTVIATYHNIETGVTHEIKAGAGEPVFTIRYPYPTEEEAQRAVDNRLKGEQDSKSTINLEMAGNASLSAELKLKLIGFKKTISGEWVVKTVVHTFDASGGFKSKVTATRD